MTSKELASKIDDLTMLYLEHQDLSKLSPEELLDKYEEIQNKFKAHCKDDDFVAQIC